ncbi:hypothetical protein JCM5353_001538 [Sporobolomyces roseus]
MQQSTSPTIHHFSSTLPTELIDHILSEGEFPKQDLARICLISKQFLDSARHSLYRQLEAVWAKPNRTDKNETGEGWFQRFYQTDRTKLLLSALRAVSHCSHLVVSFSFSNSYQDIKADGDIWQSCEQVIHEVLSLLPNIQHIKLSSAFMDAAHHLTSAVVNPESVLSIDVPHLYVYPIQSLANLRNLSKLRFLNVGSHPLDSNEASDGGFSILPNLRTLDCIQETSVAPQRFSHQLTVLRIPHDCGGVDFSQLSALRHLMLTGAWDEPINLPDMSALVELTTLYLEDWMPSHPRSSFNSVVGQVVTIAPPQKIRLVFPRAVPYSSLVDHLKRNAPFPAHEIRLSPQSLSDHRHVVSVNELAIACNRKGIKLSYDSEARIDVFRL